MNLIADIQMAKQSRSDERHILPPQEDNVNWTSNAPRTYGSIIKPFQRKKMVRRQMKRTTELPEGLQGIRLEGKEPRKTNARQPLSRIRNPFKKKKDSLTESLFCLNIGRRRVTFQLPKKKKKRSKTKRRHRKKKNYKSKVLP